MAKVSVIIPVYNVQSYLNRCVNSVLNQTLTDLEIILVDDESPDACPRMCEDFAHNDLRIKVIHKKNGGLGFARNSGLDIATGEYVAFLDSDDFIDKDAYNYLYKLSEKDNLDAVYYTYEVFATRGNVKGHNPSTVETIYEGNDRTKHLSLEMVGSLPFEKADRNVQMSSCTAFYRRATIEKSNIRFHSEREIISEDLIFNIDFLAKANRVAVIPTSFYHYFVNDKSLTHTVAKNRVDRDIKMYEYVKTKLSVEKYDETSLLRAKRLFIGYSRNDIISFMKSTLPNKEKKDWLHHILNYPIWIEVYSNFPIWKMPLKYAFFSWAVKHKFTFFIKLLCLLKRH